jgi:hypothetical protein
MMSPAEGAAGGHDVLTLAYELLDAHMDTVELVSEQPPYGDVADTHPAIRPLRVAAHLEYLRALQRTGREILARSDLFATGSARTGSR